MNEHLGKPPDITYYILQPYPKLNNRTSARKKKEMEEFFTCPMRCARSMACKSLIGFQSCSTNTTVSAPVKLSPSPPTWVVSNRTSIDGSLLNLHSKKVKHGKIHLNNRFMNVNCFEADKRMILYHINNVVHYSLPCIGYEGICLPWNNGMPLTSRYAAIQS